MSKAARTSGLARVLQGVALATLAVLGYQLGSPAPPVAVEVRGSDLVARLDAGLGPSPPEAQVGGASHVFQRAPTPGEWILRNVLVATPQEVVVQAGGGAVHLGGLRSEADPVRILGPAPGPGLRVEVSRGVTVWWEDAPEVRVHLPPGRHRLPAPPPGKNTWRLRYRSAHESGETEFDGRSLLQDWATEASRLPDAGTHLRHTRLLQPGTGELLRNPAPHDLFEGWASELLRVARDPLEIRLITNRASDLLALRARLGNPPPCPESETVPALDPTQPRRTSRTGRYREAPELVGRRVLEASRADRGYSDLMNDMVIVRVVPPPGRRVMLRNLIWPAAPRGRTPLVVMFRAQGAEDLWFRLWEVRMGGNGYRVHLPPIACPGPPREWIVWEIPPGDAPEAENILQLEAWSPEGRTKPRGLELGEVVIGRLPAAGES